MLGFFFNFQNGTILYFVTQMYPKSLLVIFLTGKNYSNYGLYFGNFNSGCGTDEYYIR